MRDCKPKSTALASSLRGQVLRVPNLKCFFRDWPIGIINPFYGDLKPVIEVKIQSFHLDDKKQAKFVDADIALFVASWWPKAEWEPCVTIAYLIIWLFIWDDEIDLHENEVSSDSEAGKVFYLETLHFIKHSLGFGHFGDDKVTAMSTNRIITSFKDLGERLQKQFDNVQLKRFYTEISFYISMVEKEQEMIKADEIPTLETFWDVRIGSGAVMPCLLMAELAMGCNVPLRLMNHPTMVTIREQTVIGICLTNDILSLKKELRSNCILSVLPLSVASGQDLNTAVDEALDSLRESVEKFNKASLALISEANQEEKELLIKYVNVMKSNQTGSLYWSMHSPRYKYVAQVERDGSMEIVL